MRWPNIWGSSSPEKDKEPSITERIAAELSENESSNKTRPTASKSDDLLTTLTTPSTYTQASTLIPALTLTTVLLAGFSFSRRYLTRIPSAQHIPPSYFRKRSLFGQVTSVGDADNFRLYHTPGGRLGGWGWLRHVPTSVKGGGKPKIKADETIHVRIAGVDAPELAHFGQPAQPFGEEALAFLKGLVDGRRVRVWIWRPDQYGRVVGSVSVRTWMGLRRTDVGLAMLKAGMATIYEAKTGAEFGGKDKEALYRSVEATARASGRGLWSQMGSKGFVSPRQFKDKAREESAAGKKSAGEGMVKRAVKKLLG